MVLKRKNHFSDLWWQLTGLLCALSLIPAVFAEARSEQKCSISHLQLCQNTNQLAWAPDFYSALMAFVTAARPEISPNLLGLPFKNREIRGDFGGGGYGVETLDGYRIFHGNNSTDAVSRASVAISDAGKILGVAVVEDSMQQASDGVHSANVIRVGLYFRHGTHYVRVRDRLQNWANERVQAVNRINQDGKTLQSPIPVTNVFFVPETAP